VPILSRALVGDGEDTGGGIDVEELIDLVQILLLVDEDYGLIFSEDFHVVVEHIEPIPP